MVWIITANEIIPNEENFQTLKNATGKTKLTMKLELGGKIKNMHPNPSILVLPMQKGDLIMMDSLNFIKKYKVIKMGGHRGSDKTLCTLDDLNTAIRWAKKQIINRDRLAVFEYRYTSEENLKKDFHFDYSLKWAAYL